MRFELDFATLGMWIGLSIVAWIFVIVLWVLVVMTPVMMYTEAECLRNGYPKYSVSVGLERYCMNLDGTVTVKVDKVSK